MNKEPPARLNALREVSLDLGCQQSTLILPANGTFLPKITQKDDKLELYFVYNESEVGKKTYEFLVIKKFEQREKVFDSHGAGHTVSNWRYPLLLANIDLSSWHYLDSIWHQQIYHLFWRQK